MRILWRVTTNLAIRAMKLSGIADLTVRKIDSRNSKMRRCIVAPALVAAIGFQISACQTVDTRRSNFGSFGKTCTSRVDVAISRSYIENNTVIANLKQNSNTEDYFNARQKLIEKYKIALENAVRLEYQEQFASQFGKCQPGDRRIHALVEIKGVSHNKLNTKNVKKFRMSIKLIEDSSEVTFGTINTEIEIDAEKAQFQPPAHR
jgi:hypothetical protein